MIVRKIMFLMVIVSGSAHAIVWKSARTYNDATLDGMYAAIHREALDLSTAEVFARVRANNDVVESFKRQFLTPPQEGQPISEERKNQRLMYVIQLASKRQNPSKFTAAAQTFCEDIALEFQEKEETLQNEIEGLWGWQVGSGIVTIGGIVLLVIAAKCAHDRSSKEATVGCGVSGLVGTIGGGVSFLTLCGKKEKLTTHIVQVQDMKQGWEEYFEFKVQ